MVDNVNHVGGAGGQVPARKLKQTYQKPHAERGADAVEFSSDVMRVRGAENIRLDKVMRIRKEIAAGTYLTPEKLDKALDSALDDALGTQAQE